MSEPTRAAPTANPLRVLCDQLGVLSGPLAAELGVSERALAAALADDPAEPLGTFLRAAERLHARVRLRPGPALSVWIDAAAVDDAFFDPGWRVAHGLRAAPRTRGELRRRIRRLRVRRRHSYGAIVSHFHKNFVATAEGLLGWRRSTIGQTLAAGGGEDDPTPIVLAPAARDACRQHVLTALAIELDPLNPAAAVQHGIDVRDEGERIVLASRDRLPLVTREAILRSLGGMAWLAGRWGECPAGEPGASADPG